VCPLDAARDRRVSGDRSIWVESWAEVRLGIIHRVAVAVVAVVVAFGPFASAKDEPQAVGASVQRGKKTFTDAFLTVAARAVGRPLAVVVDVTTYTAKSAQAIREGFLAARVADGPCSIARLGDPLSATVQGAPALAPLVGPLLQRETPSTNTVADLRKTLRSVKAPGAVLVYLCDWHFEDDEDVEGFLRELRKKTAEFHVIGSEAAFDRGWNDGLKDIRLLLDPKGDDGPYDAAVGRAPFASGPKAPWRGGETAFPLAPYRWHPFFWQTEFYEHEMDLPEDRPPPPAAKKAGDDPKPPFPDGGEGPNPPPDAADGPEPPPQPPEVEDLLERLGKGEGATDPFPVPGSSITVEYLRRFPLPSAFGPYGLLRATAQTGGRYVIFSWNPKGRQKVRYEYPRCDLFPPDLRSRKEILADLAQRPVAVAAMRAWEALAKARCDVVEHTAPLEGARTPRSIDSIEDDVHLSLSWENRGEYELFLRAAERASEATAAAAEVLAKALEGREDPSDPVDRRWVAAAHLFLHALEVTHFEVSEALTCAKKDVPAKAWSGADRERRPGLTPRVCIAAGRKAEKLAGEAAFDGPALQRVFDARRRHLERYRGTPFAEVTAFNAVQTYRFGWWHLGKPVAPGRTPGESFDLPPPPPSTPGGSGGSAPSTGGG
jgi:hypothetical protein